MIKSTAKKTPEAYQYAEMKCSQQSII